MIMTSDNEKAEHMDFDQEYGIDQLLPLSVLEDLFSELQKAAPFPVVVVFPDGTSYCTMRSLSQDDAATIGKFLNRERIDSDKAFSLERGRIAIFPITHEFENIGYLVIGCEKEEDRSLCPVIQLGAFVLKVLNQFIVYNYKNLLTGRLHGQAVEESFAQLREKAALLKKSEQKYRLLAESLEIEVEKKAKKIKETQSQLIQQEKMASIGQLAAGVAHEINNPMGFISSNLNAIEGYEKECKPLIEQYRTVVSELRAETIAAEKGQGTIKKRLECIVTLEKEMDIDFILEDIPNLIKESKEGSERIKKIVRDLKDFAHPGEDKVQVADINKGIESTLNVIRNELKYKATVTKDYGDLPPVKCYPQQLNQVIMNLLVNAAQAIEKQGEISISTRTDNGHVEIKISDTGSGIPKESLSKIFDPFFTTKEVGKGTGLGLNVAYNIIKKHKGTINVESEAGKGTAFRIRIPVD